jgi:hypothetical protein
MNCLAAETPSAAGFKAVLQTSFLFGANLTCDKLISFQYLHLCVLASERATWTEHEVTCQALSHFVAN